MYHVDISPYAQDILQRYAERCLEDNGVECAMNLLDVFEEKVGYLENQPLIGCARLNYIPKKYRVLKFWPHLWLVFQIYEETSTVKLEYIIDDRSNYGDFLL